MTTSHATPPAPPVVASVRIGAPPDVVFPYFTDPALMTKWLADTAELDARPGGIFAITIRSGPTARGSFVEVDPPHRVVFTWGVPEESSLPPGSSTVEVVLTADGDDTIVTLTHRDLTERWAESHQEGWTRHLGTLASSVRAG
jgi:uncharacterized protein YndB with AHSA1/START domain